MNSILSSTNYFYFMNQQQNARRTDSTGVRQNIQSGVLMASSTNCGSSNSSSFISRNARSHLAQQLRQHKWPQGVQYVSILFIVQIEHLYSYTTLSSFGSLISFPWLKFCGWSCGCGCACGCCCCWRSSASTCPSSSSSPPLFFSSFAFSSDRDESFSGGCIPIEGPVDRRNCKSLRIRCNIFSICCLLLSEDNRNGNKSARKSAKSYLKHLNLLT